MTPSVSMAKEPHQPKGGLQSGESRRGYKPELITRPVHDDTLSLAAHPHIKETHRRFPLLDPFRDGKGGIDVASRAAAGQDDAELTGGHATPSQRHNRAQPQNQGTDDREIPGTIHRLLLFFILRGRPKPLALILTLFSSTKSHEETRRKSQDLFTHHPSFITSSSLSQGIQPGRTSRGTAALTSRMVEGRSAPSSPEGPASMRPST